MYILCAGGLCILMHVHVCVLCMLCVATSAQSGNIVDMYNMNEYSVLNASSMQVCMHCCVYSASYWCWDN